MSWAATKAVWKHSRATSSAKLVLLALANQAAEDGTITSWRRSYAELAKDTGYSKNTVARSVKELVELGELSVLRSGSGRDSSDYQVTLPGLVVVCPPLDPSDTTMGTPGHQNGDTNAGATYTYPRTSRVLPPGGPASLFEQPPPPPAPPPNVARDLTVRVWDRKNPKPAVPFPGAMGVARALLDAGHTPAAVEEAMVAAPTITVRAVELQLNRNRRAPAAPVDQQRDAPSGVVKSW